MSPLRWRVAGVCHSGYHKLLAMTVLFKNLLAANEPGSSYMWQLPQDNHPVAKRRMPVHWLGSNQRYSGSDTVIVSVPGPAISSVPRDPASDLAVALILNSQCFAQLNGHMVIFLKYFSSQERLRLRVLDSAF
jgi:hypothetical protein